MTKSLVLFLFVCLSLNSISSLFSMKWKHFVMGRKGAKIGVLGQNGAGKSTILKIIAGEDREFDGDISYKDGVKIGYLHQVLNPC